MAERTTNFSRETITPSLPDTVTPDNAQRVLSALKQIVELREGVRGDPLDEGVTFRDLFQYGIITVLYSDGKEYSKTPQVVQKYKLNPFISPLQYSELTGGGSTTLHTHAHNNTSGLQGGGASERYHLSLAQHTDLTDSGNTTLHKHTHNDQDSLQGGTTNEYYHLTSAQNSEIGRTDNVTSVAVDTTLDDTHFTVLVTASGKTITLPAASTARIGKDWTVILGVDGYTDVVRAGSNTLTLPEVSTSIRLDNKGASVTMRCLTATSWGIA